MNDETEPDFDRTWLYRATIKDEVVGEARHGSDITACQWVAQVLWPALPERPAESALVVERQNADGTWQFVERVRRMRKA